MQERHQQSVPAYALTDHVPQHLTFQSCTAAPSPFQLPL